MVLQSIKINNNIARYIIIERIRDKFHSLISCQKGRLFEKKVPFRPPLPPAAGVAGMFGILIAVEWSC